MPKMYMTSGIAAKVEESKPFHDFVKESVFRHLAGDWGETSPDDAEMNSADPKNALSAYVMDGVKIWVKQDEDILTVLFPSEY